MSSRQEKRHKNDEMTVSYFKENFDQVFDQLKSNRQLLIAKDDEMLGVLMDFDAYMKKEELIKALIDQVEYYEIKKKVKNADENTKRYSDEDVRKRFDL